MIQWENGQKPAATDTRVFFQGIHSRLCEGDAALFVGAGISRMLLDRGSGQRRLQRLDTRGHMHRFHVAQIGQAPRLATSPGKRRQLARKRQNCQNETDPLPEFSRIRLS